MKSEKALKTQNPKKTNEVISNKDSSGQVLLSPRRLIRAIKSQKSLFIPKNPPKKILPVIQETAIVFKESDDLSPIAIINKKSFNSITEEDIIHFNSLLNCLK